MTETITNTDMVAPICDAIRAGQRFLLTSHARPDGDSIGSQLAMAYALDALGKQVRIVNADAAPDHYREFPGLDRIEIANQTDVAADVLIVMECGDLKRPGVDGLGAPVIINIDHHAGNQMYGTLNWFDESAAACGEMVFDVIKALGVPLTPEIATHIYLAILTDTGSFHHANITPRTFDICRQTVEAGVNPAAMARRVFDSNSFGKLKLIGALLDRMELVDEGRLAVLYMDDAMLHGVWVHAQRHRRDHQPAAHGARDPSGDLLQGLVGRRRARQHAIEVRRRRPLGRRASTAAAATRMRQASRSRGHSKTCARRSSSSCRTRSPPGLETARRP